MDTLLKPKIILHSAFTGLIGHNSIRKEYLPFEHPDFGEEEIFTVDAAVVVLCGGSAVDVKK